MIRRMTTANTMVSTTPAMNPPTIPPPICVVLADSEDDEDTLQLLEDDLTALSSF